MHEFNRLLPCELQREVFHACTHAKMHGGILTPYLWSDINVSITWVGFFFFKGGRGGRGHPYSCLIVVRSVDGRIKQFTTTIISFEYSGEKVANDGMRWLRSHCQ